MFFNPDNVFDTNEVKACQSFASELGYTFNEETIEIMLELLSKHIEPEKLTEILSEAKEELSKMC